MSTIYPVTFCWDGEVMTPLNGRVADRHYIVGQTYRLVPFEGRSRASHNQYFAALHDAWLNLAAEFAERFPTEEHLRKWALIRAGFRDERSIVAASKAEAQRLVAFMRPLDDYAVVIARDAVVIVYTAKSQSVHAMGKAEFQRSKQAVLDVVAELIGSNADELRRNAGQAA